MDKAKKILNKTRRTVSQTSIEGIREYIGDVPTGTQKFNILSVGVRWEEVLGDREGTKFDVTLPMILGTMEDREGNTYYLPIDGWHRAAKAMVLGMETMPVVVLTLDETYEIDMRNPPKRRRKSKAPKAASLQGS